MTPNSTTPSRLFLTAILLSVCFSASSQIEVQATPKSIAIGKVKSGSTTLAELSYTVTDGDTLYTILYNNMEYKTLTDYQYLRFNEDGGTLNKLYEVIKSVFLDENKKNKDYSVSLKLGADQVVIGNIRLMGTTSALISGPKGYVYLTEKQVDKLFNR